MQPGCFVQKDTVSCGKKAESGSTIAASDKVLCLVDYFVPLYFCHLTLTVFLHMSLFADPSPPEPPINIRVSNQTLERAGSQTASQFTERYLDEK